MVDSVFESLEAFRSVEQIQVPLRDFGRVIRRTTYLARRNQGNDELKLAEIRLASNGIFVLCSNGIVINKDGLEFENTTGLNSELVLHVDARRLSNFVRAEPGEKLSLRALPGAGLMISNSDSGNAFVLSDFFQRDYESFETVLLKLTSSVSKKPGVYSAPLLRDYFQRIRPENWDRGIADVATLEPIEHKGISISRNGTSETFTLDSHSNNSGLEKPLKVSIQMISELLRHYGGEDIWFSEAKPIGAFEYTAYFRDERKMFESLAVLFPMR